MELIYLDHNLVEQGVVQDFEFDLAFGNSENDFEIDTAYQLDIGMFWCVPDTEFGGIIDKIKTTKKTTSYSGRSWHGIFGSYNGYQLGGMSLSGNATEVLRSIVDRLQLPFTVEDGSDVELQPIAIDMWQDVWSILMTICNTNNLKIIFNYDEGINVSIRNANDYTKELYFDTSQFSVNTETAAAVPNHWIGRNVKDEEEYVKHIYTDESGEVQQFTRETDTDVMTDADYEPTDYGKVVTGIDELVETVEVSNTEEVYARPVAFNNDRSIGNIEFVDGVPFDWKEKYFTDYYYIELDENGDEIYDDDGNPKFKVYDQKYDYKSFVPGSEESWAYTWQDYYKKDGNEYKQLTEDDIVITAWKDKQLAEKPSDWYSNFSKYWTKSIDAQTGTVTWTQVEGESHYIYVLLKESISDIWSNPSSIYIRYTKKQWQVKSYTWNSKKKKWELKGTTTLYDSLSNYYIYPGKKFSSLKRFTNLKTGSASYKYNSGHSKVVVYAPTSYYPLGSEYVNLEDYCKAVGKKVSKLAWKTNTYYYKKEDKKVAPVFQPNVYWEHYSMVRAGVPDPTKTYYRKIESTEIFSPTKTYRKFTNHYSPIVDKILEELDKRKNEAAKVEPKIDTDIAEFNVGDIIGGVQQRTNTEIVSRVSKKIVKGKPIGITVDYEVG